MYIKIPSFTTDYSTTPLTDACLFIEMTNFDWFNNYGTIGLALYTDEASAYGGKNPIKRWTVTLPPTPTAGTESLPQIVSQNQNVVNSLMQVLVGVILMDPRLKDGTVVTTTPAATS